MGILVFVCPASGDTVSTSLDIDAASFSTFAKNGFTQVRCPRCANPHDLSKIASWLSEEEAPAHSAPGLQRDKVRQTPTRAPMGVDLP
jgi:hypothetical protein